MKKEYKKKAIIKLTNLEIKLYVPHLSTKAA